MKSSKYVTYNPKTGKLEERRIQIKTGKEGVPILKYGVVIVLLILVQLVLAILAYGVLIYSYPWLFYTIRVLGVLVCFRVIAGDKNPSSKSAWIMFLLLLPEIGFAVYFFWGEASASPLKIYKLKKINKKTEFFQKTGQPQNLNSRDAQNITYIKTTTGYPAFENCPAKYYPMGEPFFMDVIESLKTAEKFIFMEFFIIDDGLLLNNVISVLQERAAAGVDIRIIYDGLGAQRLKKTVIKMIQKMGIKIVPFSKVYPVVNFFMNYRDHRKIVVIDNNTAFTGGVNLADEYINAKEKYVYWKDAGIKIEGSAANSFTLMFLRMWEYSTKERPDYNRFLTAPAETFQLSVGSANEHMSITDETAADEANTENKNVSAPYCDGPANKTAALKGVYTNIINMAKGYVYIMSPYFVVDDAMAELLKNKALSGTEVRIIAPGVPDKRIVYALTMSNLEKLTKSGVRVYKYTPGFIHSKVMLSDDECAVVGSVNMDFRSFHQQNECGIYLNDAEVIAAIKNDFQKTFEESAELTEENIKKHGFIYRFILSLIRFFAPLM